MLPFRKPYGWSSAYTAMMISSFQRAGELGALVELSYDFSLYWPERARILRGLRPGHRCHHSETARS